MVDEALLAAANWQLLCAVALGLFVGVATGLFGVGGGFIITPALNILLRVPMAMAVGTCAANVLGGASFALWRQLDRRFLGIRVAGVMAIGIVPGASVGAKVVKWAKGMGHITVASQNVEAITFINLAVFAVLLTLIVCWFLIDNFWLRRGRTDDESQHRGLLAWVRVPPIIRARTIPAGSVSAPLLLSFGFFEGFVSGMLGIGGSVIMMPIMFYLIGQTTKLATQTCLILAFVSGLCSTVNHAIAGNVDYRLAVALLAGAFVGTRIGTVIRSRITGKSIRQYFTFVVLAALLMVLYKIYMMLTVDQAGTGPVTLATGIAHQLVARLP
jgi:uncharacterized membrane protein YfcA